MKPAQVLEYVRAIEAGVRIAVPSIDGVTAGAEARAEDRIAEGAVRNSGMSSEFNQDPR